VAVAERQQHRLESQLKTQASELHAAREQLARCESARVGMVSADELELLRMQLQEQAKATKREAAAREAAEEALHRQQAVHANRTEELQRELREARELLSRLQREGQASERRQAVGELASLRSALERAQAERERCQRAVEAAAAEKRRELLPLKEALAEARQGLVITKKAEASSEVERQRLAGELRRVQAELSRMRKEMALEREQQRGVLVAAHGEAERLRAQVELDTLEKQQLADENKMFADEIARLREQLRLQQHAPATESSPRSSFSTYVAMRREAVAASRQVAALQAASQQHVAQTPSLRDATAQHVDVVKSKSALVNGGMAPATRQGVRGGLTDASRPPMLPT